jgi:GPI inositol-deacylase
VRVPSHFDQLHGQPVLFIPGNAGSSRQVRSIASSSTRQYYSNPNIPALSSPLRPVDYFTVDFNEDFSALHGTTLEAQRSYSSAAVDYILSLYPQGTSIILMGHSMGGIVATGLLPHPNVSAVITMSSPHALPPARFDRRIADFYARTRKSLAHDPTPILSLCGGATDGMIPSEYCILPVSASNESMPAPYRRTVFTTALEGAWTGVGHQVMVWCHQVRWRIARAAIQLAAAQNLHTREAELDKWLSDGLRLPPLDAYPSLLQKAVDKNSVVDSLVLRNPTYADSKTYLIPIPQVPTRFVLWLDGGVILPVHPAQPISLSAYVRICPSTDDPCTALQPNVHRMLPHPFPAKKEDGVDESEGVVAFETDLNSGGFVSVEVLHGKERGFLTAGFASIDDIVLDLWTLREYRFAVPFHVLLKS